MVNSETSSKPSSLDSFDIDHEENNIPIRSELWQQQQVSPDSTPRPPDIPIPLQKRRRVTRACDECRRKKIKCDGKQPCTHCTIYNYDCTYDQPSNRRRNPTPQYIEALENRLRRAEAQLKVACPDFDLNDPISDFSIKQRSPVLNIEDPMKQTPVRKAMEVITTICDNRDDEGDFQLSSMIGLTEQLDLDERGNPIFYGESSEIVFFRRMQAHFGGLLGDHLAPLNPRLYPLDVTFKSLKMSNDPTRDSRLHLTMDLPSRQTAKDLCETAFSRTCSVPRFVHLPTFHEMLERIYEIPPDKFADTDNSFLALLFGTLALGCMFDDDSKYDTSKSEKSDHTTRNNEGFKYFQIARGIIDVTDCRDITRLQTILFMILFLQSSASLSTCYSYVGIAQRSALQMGLHRNLADKFNPIERETRRRVFWAIRNLDICVSAMLGLPELFSDDDVDQEMPIEVDDEYITKDSVLPMPGGLASLSFQAANAHTRLMLTLAKVIKYIYPKKGMKKSIYTTTTPNTGLFISHRKIKEIEQDLTQWLKDLPDNLRPSNDEKVEAIRAQQSLRLSYAYVQMMLYRPFLLYVSRKAGFNKKISNERPFDCAKACVNVSRNIVHITTEMKRRGLLAGAYGFTMYITYFSILTLVYFVLENTGASNLTEILRDANSGKETLNVLAPRSPAAYSCSTALKDLFEQLPAKLKPFNPRAVTIQKKRSYTSPNNDEDIQSSAKSPSYSTPTTGKIQRDTTPTAIKTHSQSQTRSDGDGFSSPATIRKYQRSFNDPKSPSDTSDSQLPDLSCVGGLDTHNQHFPSPQYCISGSVPDFDSVMLSSGSFAFQNNPMMEFENANCNSNVDMMNRSPHSIYLSNRYKNEDRMCVGLECHLLGSNPQYSTQSQNCMNSQVISGVENIIDGSPNQGISFHTGFSHTGMPASFEMFPVDGEVWNNLGSGSKYRHA